MALIDNLVSYWKLDESSGNAVDAFNGNTATNTSVTYTTGKINNGAVFNASAYFNVGTPSNLNITSAITINMWVKAASWSQTYPVFLCKGRNISGHSIQYALLYHTALTKFYFLSCVGVDTSIIDAYSNVTPSANTWYMVTGVFNGTNAIMYVNGANKATGKAASSLNADSAETIYIGCDSGLGGKFSGNLDEIGVWNRALTDAEVTSLYNSGNGLQLSPLLANLKSYNTNTKANIKSINTNLIANIKSLDTNV